MRRDVLPARMPIRIFVGITRRDMGLNDDIKVLHDANAAVAADVDAVVAAAGGLRMCGYSCREAAGSATVATFEIVNGATGAIDDTIVSVELAANGSETKWMWPGVDCAAGISVDHIAGTFDVTIYYYIGQDRP
jgi:hypothetical protein